MLTSMSPYQHWIETSPDLTSKADLDGISSEVSVFAVLNEWRKKRNANPDKGEVSASLIMISKMRTEIQGIAMPAAEYWAGDGSDASGWETVKKGLEVVFSVLGTVESEMRQYVWELNSPTKVRQMAFLRVGKILGAQSSVEKAKVLLFYFDLIALRDYYSTVTSGEFFASSDGLVLSNFNQILDELEWVADIGDGQLLFTEQPKLENDPQVFSEDFMQEVTHWSATDVTENDGWRSAFRESQSTGRPSPINMNISMQQLLEYDPWIDEPLTDWERRVGDSSDDQGGGPW